MNLANKILNRTGRRDASSAVVDQKETHHMKYTDLKFIQEKASGLFFGKAHTPDSEQDKAWLYDEHQLLAVIRGRFGGDHGVDLVNVLPCTQREYWRFRSRKAGMAKSDKKTRAVRNNAKMSHSTRKASL